MKRALGLSIVLLACACSPASSFEERIITEIREMEAEIEAGERLNFIDHVAEDFRGQGGSINREQLRALVVLQLRRYQNLEARLLPITVREISETEASAEFRALLTGGASWIPEDGQLYQFRTFWRLDDGDWRLTSADWEPARLTDAP